MVADCANADCQIEECLSSAQELVPTAVEKAKLVKGFPGRWKMIISKLEQIPSRLSDLSSHPCFSKNSLCKEQLQAISVTLKEAISLADAAITGRFEAAGKLRMQSDLDALIGKLDLNLRDCGLLIKTGMLVVDSVSPTVSELLARLQIGHLGAKQKALDSLVEIMNQDENTVISVLGRSNIAALVQLLTATSNRIREKAVSVICSLTESSENCEGWLVSEGVLPPLIRLVESGSSVGKEKAVISLQRLSLSAETARSIVGHGGVQPLIDASRGGDFIIQSSAACTLRNISKVPDIRQALADEGVVTLMVNLLHEEGSREYAAECLQNLTSSSDNLRHVVILEGGIIGLLEFLDCPAAPKESAVGALRNLVDLVQIQELISLGLIPRLVHVLRLGSSAARQAAASTICRVCSSTEMKKLMGETGCVPLLINMLEAKTNNGREVAAQALSCLIDGNSENRRELKKDEKSVPNLVQLLDPSPQNTAKKYAILCLLSISSSKKCKKMMISYGAIGYLKKLKEMEVPCAKKLLEQLDSGKFTRLFSRK